MHLTSLHAMGTRFELAIADEGDAARLGAIAEDVLALISDWHGRLTRFEPGSMVSRMNRDAAVRAVPVDADLFELLDVCDQLRTATHGAFDVITRAGGTPGAAMPPALQLEPATRAVRLAPGAALDFGGIAKGHVLDLAAEQLREHGIRSALLHGGTSSVIALGAPPGRAGWSIALDPPPCVAPRSELSLPAARVHIELRDQAISVSSSAERAHIRDPRSGAVVTEPRWAVVAGPSARDAEAWSTALVVLGRMPPGLEASGMTAMLRP